MDPTYDPRERNHRRGDQQDHQHESRSRNTSRTRDRSRSRSPDVNAAAVVKSKREQFEETRRSRMARLRAENEQEEQKLSTGLLEDKEQPNKYRVKEGPKNSIVQVKPDELEGMDEEEQMMALLGFGGGFGSTKGQKVDDNHNSSARGAAAKNKARKYRQYMNRKGGFNRPLDKMD